MQAADTPERRPDLVLTPVTEDGKDLTVVHDPRTGRYFRLRELEGFILSLLDGARTLESAHAVVMREYPGVRLSLDTVLKFAARLAQLGLLRGTTPGAARRRAPLFRRLLRFQSPPLPADSFFTAAQPLVRVLYQPLSLLALLLFVIVVGQWAFFSLDEFARYTARPRTPGGLLLLWAGFFLTAVCHEMGHGVTCRYFGARSNGVGVLLQYGIPCFYCDVSGAWTLSSRRQRLLIGFAGLGWQFVAGAAAFVIWKLFEPGTVVARVAHVMVAMCGFTALLNLNPFIKLDGYYLLSDWWRIANLREKSLLYFRQRVASFFLTTPAPRLGSARERGRLFWFGLASWTYSLTLVLFLLWHLSHWLLHTLHGTGALLLGGLLMVVVFSWLKHALTRARPGSPGSDSPQSEPGTGGKPEGPKGERRRDPVRPRFGLLLTLALIMAGIHWFWNAKWTFFVASPCTLEADQRVAIRPLIEGVLQDVRFGEGDRVHAGATFALIETYDLQKTREQLQQRLQSADAATQVVAQEVPLVEAEKERDVLQARQEVRDARTELDDRRELFPARKSEAERRVQEARAGLDQAEQVADRVRQDERSVADGKLTPSMQVVADRIEQNRSLRALAEREVKRAAYLVSEGALQRQKLDVATTELQTREKEEAALASQLEALRKDLRERREDAEAEVRRRRAAYDATLESQHLVELDTRTQKVDAAEEQVGARQAVLDTTEKLRQAADVKRAEVAVKRLEARPIVTEMERVEKKIHQARLSVPVSGVVSTPRLNEKVGRKFAKGETIAWIDRLETLKARLFIDEKEIGEVRKGMPVQLRVGAYPDRVFEGSVTEVAPRASSEGGKGTYEVRLRIRNPRGDLRPGITGYAKVLGGQRPLREVAFRRLHRYIRTEVWTWF